MYVAMTEREKEISTKEGNHNIATVVTRDGRHFDILTSYCFSQSMGAIPCQQMIRFCSCKAPWHFTHRDLYGVQIVQVVSLTSNADKFPLPVSGWVSEG